MNFQIIYRDIPRNYFQSIKMIMVIMVVWRGYYCTIRGLFNCSCLLKHIVSAGMAPWCWVQGLISNSKGLILHPAGLGISLIYDSIFFFLIFPDLTASFTIIAEYKNIPLWSSSYV